ncbi:rossmann fold nucleotide-binding protein Smf [Desulfocucumis palustris]|uniref:Rossmann fold nucleotide-binding protein Smf n=1 Tax=Desulfocucumis palustris TaxID=1898651 RepID=A0A2L2X8V3_9FIRM|nr:DNA-processing protein DprA [Desulfocucumis palustris]GBF32649.1 rossmann fold nucleotide-binding protein Smf [Desulfocucumis palustris]
MSERECALGWQILLPGSAKRVWHLMERFGSAAGAWRATEEQLVSTGGFTREQAGEIVMLRKKINPLLEFRKLEKLDIRFIDIGDPVYPEMLKNIFDPPPGIFIQGSFEKSDSLSVAIVGSRKATPYGLAVAERLAAGIAPAGVTVVSGLARGVDTAAHRGALATGGRTIAVLGCGIDVIYPRENKDLKNKIAARGAVISEFPLGAQPVPWHFPVRNRIISGLSRSVVVVEAAARSGALITADIALEQGRDVMAVPGNVSSPLSVGANRLIKQGARLVDGPEDILEELGVNRLFGGSREQKRSLPSLTVEEEAVLKMLNLEPVALDKLVEGSGLAAQQVLAALVFLELKGLARQLPGKYYLAGSL